MFGEKKISQSLIDAVLKVTEGENKTEQLQLDESEKVKTPTGMKVYGHSYGNSQKARADQTKKDIDKLKGPKAKEVKEEEEISEADYGTHPGNKEDEKEDVKLIKKVVKKKCLNTEELTADDIWSLTESESDDVSTYWCRNRSLNRRPRFHATNRPA